MRHTKHVIATAKAIGKLTLSMHPGRVRRELQIILTEQVNPWNQSFIGTITLIDAIQFGCLDFLIFLGELGASICVPGTQFKFKVEQL